MKNPLSDQLYALRESTTGPLMDQMRITEPRKWALLCTCLDTIDDAQSAIEAYRGTSKEAEKSELYLRTYGVLQAMFIQQDALHNLADSLDMSLDIKGDQRIKDIREIRNNVAGHPTDRGSVKGRTFYRISQHSLRRFRFEVLKHHSDREPKISRVNICKITIKNERILTRYLLNIIEHLKLKWIDHAKKFRSKSLARIISQERIDELDELLYNLREGRDVSELIARYVDAIFKAILELESALDGRMYCSHETVQSKIDGAKFAIEAVQIHLDDQSAMQMDSRDNFGMWISAYCSALRDLLLELINSSSMDTESLNGIKSCWNHRTTKVELSIETDDDSIDRTWNNINALKSKMSKISGALYYHESDSNTVYHARIVIKQMREIIEFLESCIRSNTTRTHERSKCTATHLSVFLLFLRQYLKTIRENNLEIDKEYDVCVLQEDCSTDQR